MPKKELNTACKAIFKNGDIKEYNSIEEAAEDTGVTVAAIKIRCNKKNCKGKDGTAFEWLDEHTKKSYQAKKLIEYIKLKYNNELEFLWEKYPQNAIVRRKDNAKWYALFLTIPKQKLGFDDKNVCEIINLKANDIDKIVDNKSVFPGYHMNKKHWITIILDNKVPLDFIKNKIDKSYILAKNSK